ncbi:MAG TPA: nitroreductase family deazaflavin-dependent oxidoreductase [Actinomycetota bacterium]|nr:nitroreductase family deazaflavin-dependent oxidoreductase [Actinomycetota bacterium]
MSRFSEQNARIIEAFRGNAGKVDWYFDGAPLVLLHTLGARTGREHVTPLMRQDLGESLAVFASKGGSPTHPQWFHNLVASPMVTAEVGTETRRFRARVAAGAERERIWTTQKQRYPFFADYEAKVEREIPVVILDPLD